MGRIRKIDQPDPLDVSRRENEVKSRKKRYTEGSWSSEDKKYCTTCVYRGSFNAGYLCNYFCLTGNRRGCKAGVGCDKKLTHREAELQFKFSFGSGQVKDITRYPRKEIKCERCGITFLGTYKARFCPECKFLQLRDGYDRWLKEKKGEKENE